MASAPAKREPPKPEPLLSIQQLAERWDWSQSKIRRLAAKQAIPHVRIEGRYYFEEAVIEQWLHERRAADRSRHETAAPVKSRRSHEEECARLGIEPYHEFSGFSRPS